MSAKMLGAVVALLVAATTAAAQTPGQLDNTFGTGGIQLENHWTNTKCLVQPDGKIVAIGVDVVAATITELVVARYNSNGTPDTTFGPALDGYTRMSLSSTGGVQDAALTSSGAIIIRASSYELVRLTPYGLPDTTFGNGGRLIPSSLPYQWGKKGKPSYLNMHGMAQLNSGDLLLWGWSSANGGAMQFAIRLLANGLPDMSYGSGGFGILGTGLFTVTNAPGAVDSQGRLTAGTVSSSGSNAWMYTAVRLTTAGELDTTFGAKKGNKRTGKLDLPVNYYDDPVFAGGAGASLYVAAVRRQSPQQLPSEVVVLAFDVAGDAIAGFGNNGEAVVQSWTTPAESLSSVRDAEIDTSGRLVLSVFRGNPNGCHLLRLNSNGSLDATFGSGGISVAVAGSMHDIEFDTLGRIVAAGVIPDASWTNPQAAVLRFNG